MRLLYTFSTVIIDFHSSVINFKKFFSCQSFKDLLLLNKTLRNEMCENRILESVISRQIKTSTNCNKRLLQVKLITATAEHFHVIISYKGNSYPAQPTDPPHTN